MIIKLLKNTLDSLKLSGMSQCTYNLDETGMPNFTPEAIQEVKKQSIEVIALLPHTTHQTQFLDVSFFKSLKSHWCTVCHTYMSENVGIVRKCRPCHHQISVQHPFFQSMVLGHEIRDHRQWILEDLTVPIEQGCDYLTLIVNNVICQELVDRKYIQQCSTCLL